VRSMTPRRRKARRAHGNTAGWGGRGAVAAPGSPSGIESRIPRLRCHRCTDWHLTRAIAVYVPSMLRAAGAGAAVAPPRSLPSRR
jgi:hypothetical protein